MVHITRVIFLFALNVGLVGSAFVHGEHRHDEQNSSTKKVLFVMSEMRCGGTERAFLDFIHFFPMSRSDYDVLILARGGEFERFLPQDLSLVTYKQAKRRKYTTVVVYHLAISRFWWKGFSAKRRVQWLHRDVLGDNGNQIVHFKKNKSKLLDVVVGVSNRATESFKKMRPEFTGKTVTIPNFVNVEEITSKAQSPQQEIRPDSGKVQVISVSRLSAEKGIDRAIRVHKRLNDEGIHFRWFVVGDGDLLPELEAQVSRAHLKGKFIFLGRKFNPYPYMKAADLLVNPSYSETGPLAVTEALILRRPVLSTDVGDVSEKIRSGVNGLVVNNDDEALYRGLKSLILDSKIREQYSKALQDYSYDNESIVKQVTDLLGE